MKFYRTDSRVRMSSFPDVSGANYPYLQGVLVVWELNLSLSSGCAGGVAEQKLMTRQFWFYQTTSTP